jgi:serine/threonine protein kinase
VRRFIQEAKAASALNHPNIITIYEIGQAQGTHYIATEYIPGLTLRQQLAKEKMRLHTALEVASQVAFALTAAHEAAIVHRDIKPENLVVTPDGHAKILDFGLAKLLEAPKETTPDGISHMETLAKTQAGIVLGTLRYMSPEQARGQAVDHRSDIFSLGIVLYEMVTETKPFVGAGTEVSILELVRQCVITAAREINPRVPEALDRVIMKALAREPDERYQDAGQMQRGLERFLRERPPVSARDLARFLELLFDRSEREDGGERGAAPEGGPREHTPDPMSLDSLLERFGIDE